MWIIERKRSIGWKADTRQVAAREGKKIKEKRKERKRKTT